MFGLVFLPVIGTLELMKQTKAYYLSEFDGFFTAAGKMLQTAMDIYPDDIHIHESIYDAWRSVGVDIFEPYLEMN